MKASRRFRALLKPCSRCTQIPFHSQQIRTITSTNLHVDSNAIHTDSKAQPRSKPWPTPTQQRRHASSSSTLKRTPLYDLHTSLKAKLVPFANFSMPLEYPDQSHPTSHKWTRSSCSLFDVSHMVQHKISGPLASEFLMTITPSSIDKLAKHSSTLSCLLASDGGIVDDTVITRLGRDSFYFVTNAGCRDDDLAFIQAEMDKFLKSQDANSDSITWHVLDHHSLLALQGPKAAEVLQPLVFNDPDDEGSVDTDLSTLYFGHSRWLQLNLPETCTPEKTSLSTPSLLISRTGYTGCDGFEISIPPESGSSTSLSIAIARTFLSSLHVKPAGLAARDSLRLEAGMCLYGHDIDRSTTPPVAGLGWVVPKERRSNPSPAFNGSDVINEQLSDPKTMPRRRVGFEIESGPAAREGAEILAIDDKAEDGSGYGEVIGTITSGLPAPSLEGRNIAMGYVKSGCHKKGTEVGVRVRRKVRKGKVVRMPFVGSEFYKG